MEEWEALEASRNNVLEWLEMAAEEETTKMLQALNEALNEMSSRLDAAQMVHHSVRGLRR